MKVKFKFLIYPLKDDLLHESQQGKCDFFPSYSPA